MVTYLAIVLAVLTGGRGMAEAWLILLLPPVMASLPVAALGAIYRSGEQRAAWLGFALFGFTYLCAVSLVMGSGGWRHSESAFALVFYPPFPAAGTMIARYFYRSRR